jgi:acetolactate synthase I/II/III large subunit
VPESLSGVKRKALPWVLKALPKLPAALARRLKRKLAP